MENPWKTDALDACLMVHGSWLKAHGQGKPGEDGSWPKGRPDPGEPGAGEAGPGPGACPWVPGAGPAPGHEPPLASLGHEP